MLGAAEQVIDGQQLSGKEPAEQGPLSVLDILQAERLIELLPDDQLMRIGTRCLEGFRADLQSRSQGQDGDCWEDRYKRYLNIAMQVREPRTTPWPNASNVKFPLLTTAAVQFQARAYPAIVDGANLVKGRVLGNDPQGQKRERADRIGEHMTWQLLFDMPGWEEATDRLLLQLPIVGSVFRKSFRDVVQGRNVSKTVTALDFVINYWAESIEAAPRYTEIMRFYPHEIEERFRSKIWRRVPVPVTNDAQDDSETAPIEFLEQVCRIDLDEDDYPEPYIVTMVRDSGAVVRIEPCYDEDTVTISADGEVVRIDAKQYFTQYGFFPAPDGSFYHIGFGALLDDITAAIDKSLNHLLDAGALQNSQGGFIGSGVNMRSGDLKFRLGEWKRLDVTGGSLRENIVPLALPGPSPVLFNLLQMLVGAAKEITAVQDILTGASQGATTPATTVLAQIEQATKVMTAIFKRIHRSFGQELRILFGLNRDFLDENAYYALTDQPGQIGRADYQEKDIDVVPVSDPTMVNDAQRALKAQSLLAFNGDPMVNQQEIRKRYFEGTGQPNVDALMTVEAPPPNPEVIAKAAEMENTRDKTKSEIRKNNATSAKDILAAAQSAHAMGLLNDVATLTGAAVRLATDAADMEDNGEPIDQPGGPGGVEEPQPDAGIPPVPEGPAGGADGGMVPGSGSGPVGGGLLG